VVERGTWKYNRVTSSDVMEFSDVFAVSPSCSGTYWFTEYTSQISLSNIGFHVSEALKKVLRRSANQAGREAYIQALILTQILAQPRSYLAAGFVC
jgi:hypothetical protein